MVAPSSEINLITEGLGVLKESAAVGFRLANALSSPPHTSVALVHPVGPGVGTPQTSAVGRTGAGVDGSGPNGVFVVDESGLGVCSIVSSPPSSSSGLPPPLLLLLLLLSPLMLLLLLLLLHAADGN